MSTVAHAHYPQDGLSLQTFFAALAAKRWWLVISVTVFTAVFGGLAFRMAPVYRATVILAPASTDRGGQGFGSGALGGLASAAGLGLGSRDSETEEALAVLQSREFTEGFIENQNLLPRLFSDEWNHTTGTWKRADEDHRPTLGKAFKYFDKRVRTVIEDPKTGLITLQIDWTDRNEAASWANALVRRLNEEMRARAIAKSEASMRFLEKELQSSSTVEARDAISRLIEAQVKERMLANVTPDYSFRVVDKAIPADRDDPVKPQKALLIAVGVLLGLVVGLLPVLVGGVRFAVMPGYRKD